MIQAANTTPGSNKKQATPTTPGANKRGATVSGAID